LKYVDKLIRDHLKKEYPNFSIVRKAPKWIKECHWRPSHLLTTRDKKNILAIDLLLSGTIPSYQYTKIVYKLLKKHNNFSVAVLTFEESFENNPEIEEFCKSYGIGLKTIVSGLGVKTILATPFDSEPEMRTLTLEEGWFPTAILKKAYGLKRSVFSGKIDQCIKGLKKIGNNEEKTRSLVLNTIDTLLQQHPSFRRSIVPFMKLAHFEQLLQGTAAKGIDHVLHSFRVFLAGCPIIDEFHSKFRQALQKYCIGRESDICVEYAWLLTSIFHDVGRPKEGAREMVELLRNELDDDDSSLLASGKDSRWGHTEYIQARRILSSLANFIIHAKKGDRWDGGTIEGKKDADISAEWIKIYNEMNRHGIMSAFDFLAETCRNASASSQTKHRPFIATHAAPAAMSIMLHDWRTWEVMKKIKLIPLKMPKLPMAALLIYIDTWDNYKRKGGDPLTYVKDYLVDDKGACVKVEWGDRNLMKKDEIGYIAYKSALENLLFALDIKYGMAGTL
jgi:hypothetical protein